MSTVTLIGGTWTEDNYELPLFYGQTHEPAKRQLIQIWKSIFKEDRQLAINLTTHNYNYRWYRKDGTVCIRYFEAWRDVIKPKNK